MFGSGLRGCRITGRDGLLGSQTQEAINLSAHRESGDWLRQPHRSICRLQLRADNTLRRCLWHERPTGRAAALLRPATLIRMDRKSFDRPVSSQPIMANMCMYCDAELAATSTARMARIFGCVGVQAMMEEHRG